MNENKISEIIASHFVKKHLTINTSIVKANFVYTNYVKYNPETEKGEIDFSTCHDAVHSLFTKIHCLFTEKYGKRKFTRNYDMFVQNDSDGLWMKVTCKETKKVIIINAV